MAKYFGNPNPYSQTLSRRFNHNFFILVSIVSGVALAYWVSQTQNLILAMLGYVIVGVFVYVGTNIFKQMGKNDRGEAAEITVKKILMELPDTYTIFQNPLIKTRLDIDFVLVGPTGIFSIEVKSHKFINLFTKRRFINQAFAEAMGLKEYLQKSGLNTYVHAVLVFTQAKIYYRQPKSGVQVINKDMLLSLVAQAKRVNFNQNKIETAINKLYSV